MATQAAYEKRVKIETASDVFTNIPAVSATLNQGGDVIDDTNLAGSPDFRSRIYALRDWSISLNCVYDTSDTALTAIRDAWLNRTTETYQYLPDGTVGNGFEGDAVVESFNMSGDVAGEETVSITLQGAGSLAAAS